VSRQVLRGIAENFQTWLKGFAGKRNIPVVDAPKGCRDDFVEPYFNRAKPDAVVVILKAREPARIMTAIPDGKSNRWHRVPAPIGVANVLISLMPEGQTWALIHMKADHSSGACSMRMRQRKMVASTSATASCARS
jgi:hypothetical protein